MRNVLLMREYPLRGKVGRVCALEIESFLGPVKWQRAHRRVPPPVQLSNITALVRLSNITALPPPPPYKTF